MSKHHISRKKRRERVNGYSIKEMRKLTKKQSYVEDQYLSDWY